MEVVRLLVERGADVSAEDDEGRTAYQIALQEGRNEIAQLLAGYGAENKT
jgi:ankyrin repeat protein